MSGSAFAVTHHAFSSGAGRTADRNRSHWSTSKTPSYTKSVSWQHHPMTEDVIQRITTFFHTSPDVKNREIRLEWSGDKRALPTAEEEISRVQASIIKWYASEYHNGRR
uniref:hypothetical protein n=1 Tax=Escherichia coli TaxID=562 RepID=UPI0035ABA8BA